MNGFIDCMQQPALISKDLSIKFPGVIETTSEVTRTSSTITANRTFDVALTQYVIDSDRNVQTRWTFPDNEIFESTRIPPVGCDVTITGHITCIEENKPSCVITDLILGDLPELS